MPPRTQDVKSRSTSHHPDAALGVTPDPAWVLFWRRSEQSERLRFAGWLEILNLASLGWNVFRAGDTIVLIPMPTWETYVE